LRELRTQGYQVGLIFLWLESVELAIERVKERVRIRGHNIPEETIRRRYHRGLNNLFELYLPVVDEWSVRDTSFSRSTEIVRYTEETGLTIFDEARWKTIKK
jgi:predicted ABC-type ATPase